MKKEEILAELAKKLDRNIDELNSNTRFLEDLNLDSIDLVEMLMSIEDEYEIQIPDEKAINIKTVEDFITVVLEEINE